MVVYLLLLKCSMTNYNSKYFFTVARLPSSDIVQIQKVFKFFLSFWVILLPSRVSERGIVGKMTKTRAGQLATMRHNATYEQNKL